MNPKTHIHQQNLHIRNALPIDKEPPGPLLARAACSPRGREALVSNDAVWRKHIFDSWWLTHKALHWVHKNKYDSTHKIPGWKKHRNESRQAIKAYGTYLLAFLNLCLETQKYDQSLGIKDFDAKEFFIKCCWELLDILLVELSSKNEVVGEYKKQLSALKNFVNPYKTDYLSKLHGSLVNFVQTEKGRTLYQDYWKPYLKAYSDLLADMHSNSAWICTFPQQGKIAYHPGKGRATKYLYSLSPENTAR